MKHYWQSYKSANSYLNRLIISPPSESMLSVYEHHFLKLRYNRRSNSTTCPCQIQFQSETTRQWIGNIHDDSWVLSLLQVTRLTSRNTNSLHNVITGGNQRELDRIRSQKKVAAHAKKPKESNTTLAKRKEAWVVIQSFIYRTPRHVAKIRLIEMPRSWGQNRKWTSIILSSKLWFIILIFF